ncbi:MAG: peptide deformylase [Gammaproteobacteria bacterium]|nr:peptide deformylase [Gammaproteobacteria bacterium]MDH5694075.1 peptide deformylase [Gammaproteobacteria bacterium]
MALLKILHYPDDRLRIKASPIDVVDDEIRTLADDMLETMYAAPGIGLAATQVNVAKRLIVMDISEEKNQPRVFINPELIEYQGEIKTEEGCLSVPSIYENVKRYEWVKVRALDKNGEQFELEADELLSVCIQHEMDHLEGKLFVDYLSEMKRNRIRKKITKLARETL